VLFFLERLVPAFFRLLIFLTRDISTYHFLHDQYLAVNLSFAVSHLCLARNDFRRSGLLFLMRISGSPNLMIFSLPFLQALTTNFLGPSGVR